MRAAALSFVGALLAAAVVPPAVACDFCAPGDVSLLMSVKQADAVVTATLTGKKLKFAGDLGARAECRWKLGDPLASRGDVDKAAYAKDVEIVEITDPKRIGNATKVVLMLTVTGRVARVMDVFPDEGGRVSAYLRDALALKSEESPEAVEFFAARMEDPDTWVTADVQSQFASIPFEKVRDAKDKLPVAKLRAWLVDGKVAATRKGLYGLMLGLCGKAPDDEKVLREALAAAGENLNAQQGILAGLCLLSGKPAEVLVPLVSDAAKSMQVRRSALTVARFVMARCGEAEKPAAREVFRAGLKDKATAEYAVEEMARAGDFSLVEDVKELWLDKARSTKNVRVFVQFYGALMPEAQRKPFFAWIKDNPAPNPPADE